MSKVLCNGASGFIGRHCLPLLAAAGYEVHAVRSAMRANESDLEQGNNMQWHIADLLDANAIEQVVCQTQPMHLLHLAWAPAIPGQYWNSNENFRWVQASLSLLQSF